MTESIAKSELEVLRETHAPYLKVFLTLAIFTAMEYFYARVFKDAFAPLVVGLVAMALIKAGLVGWYFMHLKFEGKWVYALLIPALILALVVVLGLVPDIANGTDTEVPDSTSMESILIAPPSGFVSRTEFHLDRNG